MEQFVNHIVDEVVKEIKSRLFIQVEASGRHAHLSQEDLYTLFGYGYELTRVKDLSQPGQYACKERISVTGPKGTLKNVVILGPVRPETQVEISMTDGLILGIKAPVRLSGDTSGTPGAIISNGDKTIEKSKGVLVAKRHIHMTPDDAKHFHVVDKEIIKIKVFGERPVIFDDVVVRVSDQFCTSVHIDYDEANACGYKLGVNCIILK